MPSNKTIKLNEDRQNPFSLLWVISIVPLVLLGLSLALGAKAKNEHKREPQMHEHEKDESLKSKKSGHLRHTSKLGLDLNVNVTMISEEPKPNEVMEFSLSLVRDGSGSVVDYKITMPAGVTIVGPTTGQIDLTTSDEAVLRLNISQTVPDDQKITIIFESATSGLSKAVTFNTLDFHKKKLEQAELMERQNAYHQEIENAYTPKE